MKLSIVIPVYNGALTIGRLVQSVKQELGARFDLDIVLVNDGSPADDSAKVCRGLAEADACVKFVDLSRNFGEHNAVMAGFNYCAGEAAVVIDDDFQNPPEEIAKLVAKLAEGYDVVFAAYERKKHHALRNLGSRFNNLVASVLIHKPLDLYLASFKAVNRFVIDELVKYRGPYPYVDGLILRITRRCAAVPVRHDPRAAGRSGYTLRKLVSLWLNMFTNFSILPLRAAVVMGALLAVVGLGAAVVFLIERVRNPDLPRGWATLIISLFVVSGVQLLAIGMVGEYLGRLFLKDAGNPQFVVRRTVNCEPRADK
jgi:undecaprenyl-phosphate 4-deoxy-4-formamido-L-arabinose transferase